MFLAPSLPPLPVVKAELVLAAARTRVAPGEDPGFTLTLVNRGRTAMDLVEIQDGSDVGWRNPSVGWNLPDLAEPSFLGRCGNTNATEERMYFRVLPGASRAIPLDWIRRPELVAGSNRVSFSYEVDPKRWFRRMESVSPVDGTPNPETPEERRVRERNAELTPLKLTSNVVTITVSPAP